MDLKRHLRWFFAVCAALLSISFMAFAGSGSALVQPELPQALKIDALDQMIQNLSPDLRTGGITHVVGQDILPGDASTLNLDFDFAFEFAGIHISAEASYCGSGCRRSVPPISKVVKKNGAVTIENPVVIYRFAKEGRITLADGTGVDWLVRMVDGETLSGTLRLPLNASGEPEYPGELDLDGKMIITLQFDGEDPVNLLSEIASNLTGPVVEWPPRGTQFQLNQQVPYYDSQLMALRELAGQPGQFSMQRIDQTTRPIITILQNQTVVGMQTSPFLSEVPEILETWVLDVMLAAQPGLGPATAAAGAGIRWRDTSQAVSGPDTCSVQYYNVYRNDQPGDLNGWRLIATLPNSQTSYVDSDWDGSHDAAYMVLNASIFNFGYVYEGSPGAATVIPALF